MSAEPTGPPSGLAPGENTLLALVRGTAGVFGVRLAGAVLGLASHAVLARMLGVEAFGVYVYAWTAVGFAVVVSRLGFDQALVRYVSRFRAEQAWGRAAGLRAQATRAGLAASLALAGAAAAGIAWRGDALDPALRTTLVISLGVVPVLTLAGLQESLLAGLKHVVVSTVPYLIVRPVVTVAVAAGFFLSGGLDAPKTMVATLLGVVVVLGADSVLVRRFLPAEVSRAAPVRPDGGWVRVSLPFLALSMSALVESRIDILMLGAITGTAQAGVYGAAVRVTALLSMGVAATSIALAPHISDLYTRGDLGRLRRMVAVAALLMAASTAGAALALVVLGRAALGLFGAGFDAGFAPLLILAAGAVAGALAGPVSHLLSMTGRQGVASRMVVASAAANVGLNLFLIPRFGLAGAATATAITTVGRSLWMGAAVWTRLGINPTVFSRHALHPLQALRR